MNTILRHALAAAAQDEPVGPTVITNVNFFDRMNEPMIEKARVVIDGNMISEVTTKKGGGGRG